MAQARQQLYKSNPFFEFLHKDNEFVKPAGVVATCEFKATSLGAWKQAPLRTDKFEAVSFAFSPAPSSTPLSRAASEHQL